MPITLSLPYAQDPALQRPATCKWIGVYACTGGGGEGRRSRGL